MAKEIYLHIGYPKTATTTLQNNLFPNHLELIYLRNKDENLSFMSDVFFARENSFKRSINSYKNELLKKTNKSKLNKFVYSEESLTSFSMFFRFQPRPYIWTVEPNSIARKLHISFSQTGVFDTVKILVTIRRQDEMLKSMYAQVYNFVFKKFSMTNNFRKFLNYSLFENEKGGIIDSLFYNDVVMEYEKLFGKENICVLVFEELKEDSRKYIKKLCDFMNIDSASAIELIKNKHANKRSSDSGYKSDERNLIELLSYYKNIFLEVDLMDFQILKDLRCLKKSIFQERH